MGKPAARQGDMTYSGGPITQGSRTVLIGTSGGVACSSCPGGVAEGNPVNPMLGAKVLSEETDISLPGPISFVLSRDYSSYQVPMPAPVGLLGPGWWLPSEPSLHILPQQLILNDSKGRSIPFDPLDPGEIAYCRSEQLWLIRGGVAQLQGTGHTQRLATAWAALPEAMRLNPDYIFVSASPLGPWWLFAPGPQAPTADEVSETGAQHFLYAVIDSYGRAQEYQRHREGDFISHVHTIIDSAGRRYQLELQRIRPAQPTAYGWGADSGIRLMSVHLRHDPWLAAADLPTEPLVRYEYSRHGELIAVYGRDGQPLRQFEYDSNHPGRMTGHTFTGRPTSRYRYDEQGRVVEQSNPDGLHYQFDYSPYTDCSEQSAPQASTLVTDSLGRKRRYIFTGKGGLQRVATIIEADGSRTENRYSSAGILNEHTDPLGRTTRYTIDTVTGNITNVLDPAGRNISLEYNQHNQLIRRSYPSGNGSATEHWHYDPQGRLLRHTSPLGHSTHYHYPDNATGNTRVDLPIAIIDAKGGRKQLHWNVRGQLTQYTDCSGRHTHYSYNPWGQLIQVRGEEGQQQTQEYSNTGRLVASTNALNEITRYQYNSAGDLIQISYPDDTQIQLMRDPWGRVTRYQYGKDGKTQSQYYRLDPAGRLIELHNENASVYRFKYDSQDHLIEEIGFDGVIRSYQYNLAGGLIQSKDAQNEVTYHYDKKTNQLQTRKIIPLSGNGKPSEETYQYDAAGGLISARHTIWNGYLIEARFKHDSLGHILAETQSMSSPTAQTLWSHHISHQYDELGNTRQSKLPGLPELNWLTYGSGHLHGLMLGEQNLLDIERDAAHRETLRRFGASQIQYEYDRLSRLSGVRLSCTASVHTHDIPGSASHPSAGGPPVNPYYQLSQFNRDYHYNRIGQLTRIDTQAGPLQYGYDAGGRLTQSQHPGQPAQYYQFDPAGNRLFERQPNPQATRDWAEQVRENLHNPDFDLLQAPEQESTQGGQFCWKTNRILEDDQYRYRYDAVGNLIEKIGQDEHHRYQWDHANRLIAYNNSRTTNNKIVQKSSYYFYDVFGRRIASQCMPVAPGESSNEVILSFYGWQGDRLTLTEQRQQQGEKPEQITRIHTVYEPGGFRPLLRIETGDKEPDRTLVGLWEKESGQNTSKQQQELLAEVEKELRKGASNDVRQMLDHFGLDADQLALQLQTPTPDIARIHQYHCDHLGTPLALINLEGKIEWEVKLDSWGNVIEGYNPANLYQPIRMQGQHHDDFSGLHYNFQRHYDPKLGRYISTDPIGLMGGINTYAYANQQPTKYVDPKGLYNLYDLLGEMWKDSDGAVSLDGGISGHVIAGSGGSVGVTIGKNKGDVLPNGCVYFQTCQTLGPGAAGGVAATATLSNSGPTSGVTYTAGAFGTGGFLGDFSGAAQVDIKNTDNKSISGGFGAGGGAAGGAMTCQQYAKCIMH